MKNTLFVTLLVTGLFVAPGFGQCGLTTSFDSNNGQDGNMFDVEAITDIDITGFDVNINGTPMMEVWYRPGSYLGFETSSVGWIQALGPVAVTSNGADVPTPLPPLPNPINIPAGQTYGIYVTTVGGGINYTNGSVLGALLASDDYLKIFEGHGGAYFSLTFAPRFWNGTIYYTYPGLKPLYQANTPQLSVDIDGATSGPTCEPVIVNKEIIACTPITPATWTLTISSTEVGAYYDLLLSTQPLVAPFAGGFILSDDQVVNVDLFSPYTWFSSGTSTPAPMTLPSYFPGATASKISLGYSVSSATLLTVQGVVLSGASPLGFVLSQATELNVSVVPPPTSVPGPVSDSSIISVDVTSAPTCWCAGGVPFYGSAFSTIHVTSNGFVSFGGTDTDATPSLLDAINDDGRVGFWTDLDPADGGTVTISNPAPDVIRVDWTGVFYDFSGPGNTFGIQFDCATGVIQIDGLDGLQPNTGTSATDDQWLGISPGITFAPTVTTDPGAAPFGLGANGFAAVATDMLYEFNDVSLSGIDLPASVLGGMTALVFTPDGMGNYTWAGM